jgi:hypothetical protein
MKMQNPLLRVWNRRSRLLTTLLGTMLVTVSASQLAPTGAVQLADGSTVFDSPPRLTSFTTTENTTNRKYVTYYVTVNLLPEAGESLETLQVTLTEGRFTRLDYHTDDIEVFAGDRQDRQTAYPIAAADYDSDSQTLTVQLAEAAPPGQTLTFALKPVRNPTSEGVYLFEVMAAPAGDNPVFQRVGTGRLNIYDPFEPSGFRVW